MLTVLYDIPLPNDGENYKFTKDELYKLLQNTFDSGIAYCKSLEVAETETFTYCNFDGDEERGNK